GSQLPSFVQFNPQTGEFQVNAEQARQQGVEAVDVKVVGRDTQGNEASADFRIIVSNTEGSSAGQPNPEGQQAQPGQGQQPAAQPQGQAPQGQGPQGQQTAPADQDASIAQPAGKLALADQLRQTGPGLFQAQRDALLSALRDQAA
ncbi:hypothetical protein, partial [Ferrovibrio sp.]|uniref:hypothetical protein n=1 Tax=Ferrovibrio sp. TaxID=1917215 RepID=UPI0025C1E9A3